MSFRTQDETILLLEFLAYYRALDERGAMDDREVVKAFIEQREEKRQARYEEREEVSAL